MEIRRSPIITALLVAAGSSVALAQGPIPKVPKGYEAPGAYPNTVTGAVIDIRNVAVPQEPDQGGEDNMYFTVPASGPFNWTSARNNGGDFGLNISPFYGASDPRSFPEQPANNFIGVNHGTTYAWRLSYGTGVSFATPRSNGAVGQFVYNGTPITLHYTAAVGNSSTAQGYSMYSGYHTTFETSLTYGCDLMLGCAGIPDRQEAIGNVAVAYFPFEQGWIGGHYDPQIFDWDDYIAASPNLSPFVVTPNFDNSTFRVDLPKINSAADGMLFVNSTQPDSTIPIIAAYPNAGGWTIFSRADDDTDSTGTTGVPVGAQGFSFLYIPYTAGGLVGGHVNGDSGVAANRAGTFTLSRLSEGRYSIAIPGKNDTSGALIVSGCGHMTGTADHPDRTFFSYEYDAPNSRFIVESREIVAGGSTPWGRTPTLRDSDFYFVWIDFTNPLTPVGGGNECEPDFNGDGDLNSQDFFDFLNAFFAASPTADYNVDGVVNSQDFFDFLNGFFAGC